jgi:glutamine synthetase|tara:strand:- start:3638 stop:5002 length:1365 start_codon:yes stop_codon:yes gene_type:complete
MNGMLDLAGLTKLVESGDIDTVVVAFTDMQGRLIGKRITGHFFLSSVVKETHACNYLLACDMEMEPVPGFKIASWDKGYGDFVMKPDLDTLRLVPWLEKTALVLTDVLNEDGTPAAHAPRSILKHQLKRLADRGWCAKKGSELEFYCYNESYAELQAKGYRDMTRSGSYSEDYHIFQTTKEEPLIRAIRNGMDACGIPVETSKGEWGPGQEEINFIYDEALRMADNHVIYKNGAKEIAYLQDKAITFMAKPTFEHAGSSCHIHSSLWQIDGDKALFSDASDPQGMSPIMRSYVAGLLAGARDMTYFLAPFINSYKRFQSGSFAPTKAAWSMDNRTAGFRVVGHGKGIRIECRIPGADCNPYLAFAAMVAAGLNGIDKKMELPPVLAGNVYENKRAQDVPKTLRDAIKYLDKSKLLRAAFGDEVIDHYVHAATWEQSEYDRRVTDWEVQRLFERV